MLYVGRLEPEKGPLRILEIAERLKEIEFWIAGYGSLRAEMEKTVSMKKINNVKLLGVVAHEELPQLYRSADIFILPTNSEGLPVAMLEAIACELPVVVTNVGAVNEVLNNGSYGFVVHIADTDSIVSVIRKLSDEPELRLQVGKRARDAVMANFSNYTDNQLRIYESTLHLRRHRRNA